MPKLTVFHNPTCTKSKRSVALLDESSNKAHYDLDIIEYKKQVPSPETLMVLSEYLGLTKKDPSTKPWDYLLRPEAQGKAKSFEEAFQIVQDNPALLERPFVIDWDRKLAVLGRPDISAVEKLVDERVSGKY
ncbi:uncharacterized protein BX663DRAFT_502970 [Cokeromyces recurvatus]|uniref:uncharacterized protein n=1 Tax=Cokeromyces recurvatus TaxID=90255 RepID=UPI00221EC75F|nr:uncharacterized protein BX663DRAFT_502970 [Cokeromyces recurvatus]KAI7904613.1 hypothetical protein BX663DRAFT_502970 [Cokeromyces recurvatus]